MSNRHIRRAQQAAARRAQRPDQKHFERLVQNVQKANELVQRYNAMVAAATQAHGIATILPTQEKGPDWTEEDGEPNAFRDKLLAETQERMANSRELHLFALLDLYDAWAKFDEPQPLIEAVPALVVP